jgi:hypothetical protein
MTMRWLSLGVWTTAVVMLAGCGGSADRDGVVRADVLYGIRYTVGADAYDDKRATAALNACLELPGASSAGQDDSLPPGPSVRFKGDVEDQDVLERCLRALPNVVLSGPRPVPSGF